MANVLYSTDKLRRIVAYVGQTQPVLEKLAAQETELKARIPGVVDLLVKQGLLASHLKAIKIAALEKNPVEILDLLSKTAELIVPKSLGKGDGKSEETIQKAADVFENRLMGNK